jgi:2-haloacid dehalogenase
LSLRAVVFDVGNVLYRWRPEALYEASIPDALARAALLREVVTLDWHLEHDLGRDFAETSAERIALFPEHRDHILAWGERFRETIIGPVPGMLELVRDLDAGGVPLYAITNFSHEFFPPFRAEQAEIFDRFRDIVVSGVEKLCKPDPAIYALALERFGLEPGEGIFIDDTLANVKAAQANGFVGHHFTGDVDALRAALIDHLLVTIM